MHSHNIRKEPLIQDFLQKHNDLKPIGVYPQIQKQQYEIIRSNVRILSLLVDELKHLKKLIKTKFEALPQAHIYRSMPNVGSSTAPRLAALFGSKPSQAFQSKQQALAYFGQSPITWQTGSKYNKSVSKRRNCQRSARHTIYLWARSSNFKGTECWTRRYIDTCKDRGDPIPTRYRKLGKKLVTVLYRCLADNVEYDEEKYYNNLHIKA